MKIRIILIGLLATFVSACGHEGAGGIAVMDLDSIAAATGQDDLISQRVQAAGVQLNAQLEQVVAELQNTLETERAKYGDNPTLEQQQNLAQLAQQAQTEFAEAEEMARQQATQYRSAIIQQFVDQVKPIAAEIAERKGASAILTESPAVFWHDSNVDITDEVIAEVRARGISLDSMLDGDDEIDQPAADTAPVENAN